MKPWQMMRGFGGVSGGTGGAWATAFSWTDEAIANSWGGYSIRCVINSSVLVAGTKMRITLGAGGSGLTLTKCFIQAAAASGDAYDFSTSPEQVKFSGDNSLTLAANASRVSDEIALAPNTARNLIVSAYISTGNVATSATFSGMSTYYASGDTAATVNASGYTLDSIPAEFVKKLEIFA